MEEAAITGCTTSLFRQIPKITLLSLKYQDDKILSLTRVLDMARG